MILLFSGVLVVILTVAFQKNNKSTRSNAIPVKAARKKNEQLVQLNSHVNDSSKTYALPPKSTIPEILDPIVISKDSFHLVGNGSTFIADSLYKGPAFVINPAAKHIILDSLVFENFDVGIIVQKNNITLRNIRFINCRVPVEYLLSFRDSVISGKFKDSIFINKATLK